MSRYSMSDEVRRFLSETIASVAQLELVLLLRTSVPKRWTVAQLVEELRVDGDWASKQLEALCREGLSSKEGEGPPTYFYRPASTSLEQTVSAVAQDYLLNRVAVIEFIYGRQRDTLRLFADAFRLRKDPPRG